MDFEKCPAPNQINQLLYARYGEQNWWPAASPYEVMLGAVLTQNTNWRNVEKALANFKAFTPEYVESLPLNELQELIRPAGFFLHKSLCLKDLTAWYKENGYSMPAVQRRPLPDVRRELLALRGIGPETADAILLYAFELPSFVVDAYTRRLLMRLRNIDAAPTYDAIKNWFEQTLNSRHFNNLHALIVQNAKQHCRKTPACNGCPLSGICKSFASPAANEGIPEASAFR